MMRLTATIFLCLLFSCTDIVKQPPIIATAIVNADSSKVLSDTGNTVIMKEEFVINVPAVAKKTVVAASVKAIQLLQNYSSIQEDFATIEKGFQKFTININSDTTVYCNEGTTLNIKTNAFLFDSTGLPVKDSVSLQVKEFYKLSDIILANLSTHSSNSIIETGGMVFIQAFCNQQKCHLKENMPIQILFPYAQQKDSMLLFTGVWENRKVNWIPFASQDILVNKEFDYGFFQARFENILNNTYSFFDSLNATGTNERALVEVEIATNGKARITAVRNNNSKIVKTVLDKVFAKMPLWQPAISNSMPVKSRFQIPVTFINGEGETDDIQFQKSFEITQNDTLLNEVKVSDIRRYIFSTSKLGWINCDRFYNKKGPKTDFNIDCGDYNDIEVKMVFHSFKSILEGYPLGKTCTFNGIPLNEKITIVAVKKNGGNTFIALSDANTSQLNLADLSFEKVTMEKLRIKLEQLNTIQQ
ncbi:hypothetical protein [Ferruginibacter sp. SUN106]|uniref:hypothetical protein n=1 Tax=Ferruginibacter sp. SUN106 TaxID=2978348 RepID=UPI003D360755